MAHYECDCCGACCRGHLIVEADQIDFLREPRLVAADPYYSGRPQTEVLTLLRDDGRCLMIAAGYSRPCPFLDPGSRCSIYMTRPNACVAMEPGDEQCQEARRAAGLLPLAPTSSPV